MWFSKAILGCFVLVVGAFPSLLFAHATPISYTPDLGATELSIPSEVTVHFTERIELDASSLTVFDPNGEEVQVGKGTITGDDKRSMTVPIRDAGEGVYTVSWQVVSVDDGHFTKGANSFLVDATGKEFEGSAGGVQVTYVTRPSEAAFNFLGLLGESLFLAVIFLLAFLLKPLCTNRSTDDPQWDMIRARSTQLVIVSFALLLIGGIATIVRKTSELAVLQNEGFGSTILTYLNSTVGSHIVLKVFIGALFTALFIVFRRKIFQSSTITAVEWVLMLLILCILYLQSSISHAAASHFYPELSVWITVIHLFAKEFIIGAAVVFLCLFNAYTTPSAYNRFKTLLPRYDALAAIFLLIAGVTGVYVTWLHLKRFDNFFDTDWGVRFIALLIATALLGAFRMWHQFIVHPALGRSSVLRKTYRVTLPVEVFFGLVVLFYSGYISVTTPPFTVEQTAYKTSQVSDNVKFTLESHPYEKGSFRILLQDAKSNEFIDTDALIVSVTNNLKGIGPNVLQVDKRFTGAYMVKQQDLSPAGEWEVSIVAQRNGKYDSRTQFTIQYPDDVLATKYSDQVRVLNSFVYTMVWIGIGIIIFSVLLFGHAYYQLRRIKSEPNLITSDIPSLTKGSIMLSIGLCSILIIIGLCVLNQVVRSDFERSCIKDGFEWKQAFPTRNAENVSQNSLLGCSVHGGHFHFVDEREYRYFMSNI